MSQEIIEDNEAQSVKPSRWPRWAFIGLLLSTITMSILWFAVPRFQAQSYKIVFLIGNDKLQSWSMEKLYGPQLRAEVDILSDCFLVLIHHPNPNDPREDALFRLSRLGRHPNVNIEAFTKELDHPDSEVRKAVILFLGHQRERAAPAIPKLIESVKRYEHDAVIALSNIGPEALPQLEHSIQTGNGEDRRLLLRVLFRMGKRSAPAVPMLISLLNDADPEVLYSAIITLGAIGPEAAPALPILVKHLSNPHAKIQQKAIWSLGQIGPAAKGALPALKPLFASKNEMTASAARQASRLIEGEVNADKN